MFHLLEPVFLSDFKRNKCKYHGQKIALSKSFLLDNQDNAIFTVQLLFPHHCQTNGTLSK